ncbi:MAG: phosphoribosylglycinamide formyltransferase [Thioalkalivibrionaceae bacterium]
MNARVAVLLSGRGSNLQALIDHFADHQRPAGTIIGVLSNRPHAGGLDRARLAKLPTAIVDHQRHADRESFDSAVDEVLQKWSPDVVVLAGFMRILTPRFVSRWQGRLLNIHPSLLPALRGLDTHRRALAAGLSLHGTSVHLVTAELDGGPVLARAIIPVESNDTPEALAARVQKAEHQLYPAVIEQFCWRTVQACQSTLNHVDAANLRDHENRLFAASRTSLPEDFWFDERHNCLTPAPEHIREQVRTSYAALPPDA